MFGWDCTTGTPLPYVERLWYPHSTCRLRHLLPSPSEPARRIPNLLSLLSLPLLPSRMLWFGVVQIAPRVHMLKLNPHSQRLRGWKLNPTIPCRGWALGRAPGLEEVTSLTPGGLIQTDRTRTHACCLFLHPCRPQDSASERLSPDVALDLEPLTLCVITNVLSL